MGLFGKSKRELLEWQQLLIPNSSKLVLSEQQLRTQTLSIVNRHIEISQDCVKLINTTNNPDTYFERFELLIEELQLLSRIEKYIKFSTKSPKNNLKNILNNKTNSTNAFIDRYWTFINAKADTLKTERGKNNQYNKFFSSLSKYENMMTTESISYYKQKLPNKI